MRPHREPGIRRDARGRIQAYVRAGGQLRFKRFPVDTSLETVRRWRLDTRVGLRLTQRAPGTLAADIEPFLRQIADRPKLVAERRQQLEWWAGAPRPAPSSRHHPGRCQGRSKIRPPWRRKTRPLGSWVEWRNAAVRRGRQDAGVAAGWRAFLLCSRR